MLTNNSKSNRIGTGTGTGYNTRDTGHRTPDTGHRTPDTELCILIMYLTNLYRIRTK